MHKACPLIPALLILAPYAIYAQTPEDEFVGPFASWSDLQRDYGKDSAALQRALNAVGTPGHSSNLFLRAGTYCVQPLSLASRLGVSIVGEDPATTIVKYCGQRDGILLNINGVAYSRIDRLTLDCAGMASVAIDQSWDGVHGNFDTGNEYADVVFRNCAVAVRGGNLGYGFAETSVLRARFGPSSGTCVILKNFNALDLWIWYSLFDQCYIGVTNDPGAGNFHVYNSVFRNSTKADMSIHNTGGFNIRNNTSVGSKAFWITSSPFRYPALTTIQGNTLINGASPAIVIGNQGPALLIDNQIQSSPTRNGPVVAADGLGDTDLVTVGNIFTVKNPVSSKGRYIGLDDKTVSSLRLKEPSLPGTPPNLRRRIFEVPKGATAAGIQEIIDAASQVAEARPIVHIPEAAYAINTTLVLPRGSDLQIVGDGYFATRLSWMGPGTGPVFHVLGPSKITFRELAISGSGTADAVLIDGIDQPGSRVYMQQAHLNRSSTANLLVDGLDFTNVDLRNIGHSGAPAGASIKVIGGKLAAAGNPRGGKTNLFSGASSDNALSYDLSNNGRLLVRDIWYESGSPTGYLHLSDGGTFTLHGSRAALPPFKVPAGAELTNFHGSASFLGVKFDDRIVASGDGPGSKILVLGFMGGVNVPDYLLNGGPPGAQAVLLNSRNAIPGGSSVLTPNQGTADPSFLRQMLSQTRAEQPQMIGKLPDGVSDIRFYRVSVSNAVVGIHLRP